MLPLSDWKQSREQQMAHVVHVSLNQRTVYIGDEYDKTRFGKSIMGLPKAWKSAPIQSWSGGKRIADPTGQFPNKVVCAKPLHLWFLLVPRLTPGALGCNPGTAF